MDFETALRREITSRKATKRAKRILAILDAPKSKRRTRRLERMERHAAVVADLDSVGAIDWGSIDWAKLFEQILAILMKLLPLILAL